MPWQVVKKPYKHAHNWPKKILKESKTEHNFVDIRRKNNSHKRLFTYHNSDKTIHCRIDRILDHDSGTVIIWVNKKKPKGSWCWKLNISILKHKNFQNITKGWQKENRKYQNHNDWWEMGKIYFKKLAIDYYTKANQKLNEKYRNLTKYIVEVKSKSNPESNKIKQFQELLNELKIIRLKA